MFPRHNPFSDLATTVIEGSSLAYLDQPTLLLPSVERLERLVERYGAEYRGRAIAVHGEHGSGKTHALARAITILGATHEGRPPARTVYVKADDRDPLSFYRKVMSQVPMTELQELCRQAQESHARAEFAESRGRSPEESRDAISKVDEDPDWVNKAFEARELQPTAVLRRLSQDFQREGIGGQDFDRVLPNLLNPDLDVAAYRWITGQELPEHELRRLGVTAGIDDTLKVRTGIHALLTLSQGVSRPFALLIDQAEAFLTGADGSLDRDNVGLIRVIVESVPRSSGLVVVALREQVWQQLPLDLRQRFGPSEIATTGLTVQEANSLVALLVSGDADGSTSPFLPDGLREVLRNSGGNIRRFLQLCSLAFTVAAPKQRPIDGEVTRAIFSRETNLLPDGTRLKAELAELLRQAHVPFTLDKPVGTGTVDIAVTELGGRNRAFLVVSDALFGSEEVALARQTLDLVRRGQDHERPAEVVLVVAGYMSEELASGLGEVHRVVVTTPEGGAAALASLVADLRLAAPAAPEAEIVTQRLAELERYVATLEEQRTRDEAERQELATALIKDQSRARRSDELDEARRQWRELQETVLREVRDGRRARQDDELLHLDRLREKTERDRRWFIGLGSVVTVVVLSTLYALIAASVGRSSAIGAVVGLVVGMLAGAVWLALAYAPACARDLAGPVRSVEELDRVAHAYLGSRWSVVRLRRERLLRHRNPQFRYAAAVSPANLGTGALLQAFRAERSAIVRRAIVRSAVARGGESVIFEVAESGDSDATSVALASGRSLASKNSDTEWHRVIAQALSPDLRTLAIHFGYHVPAGRFLDAFVGAISDGVYSEEATGGLEKLVQAYVQDDDLLLLGALDGFAERDFRAAISSLSSFDDGRLGTMHWLVEIDAIDQLYLFFRKCTFYVGRGLETATSAPRAVRGA